MKKSIFLFSVALILSAYTLQAQEQISDNRDKLQLGIKGGLNFSNIYDTDGEEFDADGKFGFVGGVFLAIPIGKYLGIQPEVLYSQKGYKSTGSFLGTNYEMKRTTNFIDVPILLQVKPVEFVTLLAGPQYSFMLKRKDEFTGGSLSAVQEEEFENDDLRNNILGVIGGADFNFENLVLGVRAGWDLQNNFKDEPSTTPRYRNVWYQATIGFRF